MPSQDAFRIARQTIALAIIGVSALSLLGPVGWRPVTAGLLGLLAFGYCWASVASDRLRGKTLAHIAEDFRAGRIKLRPFWEDAAMVLLALAVLTTAASG